MAQKTTKKTKATTVVKKSRPVAKKTVKKVARPVAVEQTPMHECNCCNGCQCGCRCGHRFVKLCIKVVILAMVFLLGCVYASWVMNSPKHSMMRHIQFNDNGCVVMESVQCPKMLEKLAVADVNADGCVSRDELRAVMPQKRDMHKHHMNPEF